MMSDYTRDHPFLACHEIGEARIKKSTIRHLKTTDHYSKSLGKNYGSLAAFQQIGILPKHKNFVGEHHIKQSVLDRSGTEKNEYALGVHFSKNSGGKYFVQVKGKGAGESIHSVLEQKDMIQNIEIISGTCLFGSGRILFANQDGKYFSLVDRDLSITEKVCDIIEKKDFSLYEMDSVLGLSSFINDLSASNNGVTKIHIEVPHVQYYFYLARAYDDGHLSSKLYMQYIDAVEFRARRIFAAFSHYLHHTGIHQCTTLQPVQKYMTDTILKNKRLSLEKIQELLRASDPLWDLVLNQEQEEITWERIMFLSYSITVMQRGGKQQGKVLLQVDDPIEQKILLKTSQHIPKAEKQNYRIWGLYPMQKVFLDPEYSEESDLFYGADIDLTENMRKKVFSLHNMKYSSNEKLLEVDG